MGGRNVKPQGENTFLDGGVERTENKVELEDEVETKEH